MTTKLNLDQFYTQYEDGITFAIDNRFEDFKSTMCAKTSRSITLEKRLFDNDEEISRFLEQNSKQYGHASIADMANVGIFLRGFSDAMSCMLLCDYPLFQGQICSIRAIDTTQFSEEPGYDCINCDLEGYHKPMINIFKTLKEDISGKGFKFDRIRWALPGSIQSGCSHTSTARSFIRHMEQLKGLNDEGVTKVANRYLDLVIKDCCPVIIDGIYRQREPIDNMFINIVKMPHQRLIRNWVKLTIPSSFQDEELFSKLPSRCRTKTMIDPSYNSLGLIKVEMTGTISVMRDLRRHRACYPMKLELCVSQETGQPEIGDQDRQHRFREYEDRVRLILKNQYKNFNSSLAQSTHGKLPTSSLWHFPLGTSVKMTFFAPLDKLIYLMELRRDSAGVDESYKELAIKIHDQLIDTLPYRLCEKVKIA